MFTDLAQILYVNLVRGSNHEMDIFRLKYILRGKLQPFRAPLGHGNEADQERLFNAWAPFAFSVLLLFLL